MKKRIGHILLIGALFVAMSGSASVQIVDEQEQYIVPEDIIAAFDEEEWNGYLPVFPTWYLVDSGYENGAFFPVIMKKGEENVLCVLSKHDDIWGIDFVNRQALFSGSIMPDEVLYYVDPYAEDYSADFHQDFDITYEFDEPENGVFKVTYYFGFSDGEWRLRVVQVFYMDTVANDLKHIEMSIRPSDGSLLYREAVYGTDNPPEQTMDYAGSYLLSDFDINSILLTWPTTQQAK